MNFDSLVFPAPSPTYTFKEFSNKLFFVPKYRVINSETRFDLPCIDSNGISHIPCYYKLWASGAPKLILFFHGNAEDIGRGEDFVNDLYDEFFFHIISVEYPGYGIYPGNPDETSIFDDGLNVYDYITKKLGWPEKDIIIFGRSIGSGPATHIASLRQPGMLVLMSGFTCIKDVDACVRQIA